MVHLGQGCVAYIQNYPQISDGKGNIYKHCIQNHNFRKLNNISSIDKSRFSNSLQLTRSILALRNIFLEISNPNIPVYSKTSLPTACQYRRLVE